jgi:hypothetical protein
MIEDKILSVTMRRAEEEQNAGDVKQVTVKTHWVSWYR